MRSFDTLSKSDLRAHLIAAVAFASRNDARLRYAAIPTELGADSLAFEAAAMRRLFETGETAGASGTAFSEVMPEASMRRISVSRGLRSAIAVARPSTSSRSITRCAYALCCPAQSINRVCYGWLRPLQSKTGARASKGVPCVVFCCCA